VANDYSSHAQGLDRPARGGRKARRKYLAGAPGAAVELATKPEHLRALEEWMKSYRPEELFDTKAS
jgi:phosphoketolase